MPLDGIAALMHSGCSTDTRAAVMNDRTVRLSIIAMLMLATLGITSAQETSTQKAASVAGPVLSNTGHDAAAYGADEGYPLGTLATGAEMRHLVATYSHFDELTPARIVSRAAASWSFQRAAEPEIYYSFGGERHTIAIISADSLRPDCCSPGTTLFYTNTINTRDRIAIAFSPSRWRRPSPPC